MSLKVNFCLLLHYAEDKLMFNHLNHNPNVRDLTRTLWEKGRL